MNSKPRVRSREVRSTETLSEEVDYVTLLGTDNFLVGYIPFTSSGVREEV